MNLFIIFSAYLFITEFVKFVINNDKNIAKTSYYFLLNELFNIEVQKGPKLKLRRKIRIEVSLDDLLISEPEVPDIDQLLASESMAGEEEEQTKTLQPHLSKQDVKTLVCKQDSTSTSLYSYIKQSLKYEFFISQF